MSCRGAAASFRARSEGGSLGKNLRTSVRYLQNLFEREAVGDHQRAQGPGALGGGTDRENRPQQGEPVPAYERFKIKGRHHNAARRGEHLLSNRQSQDHPGLSIDAGGPSRTVPGKGEVRLDPPADRSEEGRPMSRELPDRLEKVAVPIQIALR